MTAIPLIVNWRPPMSIRSPTPAPIARHDALHAAWRAYPHPVFVSGPDSGGDPTPLPADRPVVRLRFDVPPAAERARLWRAVLGAPSTSPSPLPAPALLPPGVAADVDDADVQVLAGTFRLTPGQIGAAARAATDLALARPGEPPTLPREDLAEGCRAGSTRTLATVARRVSLRHGWDDLVLPPDERSRLTEISDQIRYRGLVHDDWGFADRLTSGRGINLLFAGPPGTGKTMAASVLARSVGLDLYVVDLSATVSKYIGETEKHLERIFAEARAAHAMLLFDEADALFGKRSSVRDAHDRYANLETSYLLQKLENHDGVIVLASNLRKNMDDAFTRRLQVTIDFPLPGPDERLRIWERSWPPQAPRHEDVDLSVLAREVEVSGGSIRNILLTGAFLAAADGGTITMTHLRDATRTEYRKMGKVLVAPDRS